MHDDFEIGRRAGAFMRGLIAGLGADEIGAQAVERGDKAARRGATAVVSPVATRSITGVNYDPVTTAPSQITSLHVDFRVRGTYRGAPIDLTGSWAGVGHPLGSPPGSLDHRKCAAGTTACYMAPDSFELPTTPGIFERDVRLVRFAQHGSTEVAGTPVKWLAEMEEGAGLLGTLSGARTIEKTLTAPTTLTLGGRMVVTLEVPGSDTPQRLRSREEVVQTGSVRSWPPTGDAIRLQGSSVPYYLEEELDRSDAEPVLWVENAEVAFLQSCPLMDHRSEFSHALPLADDGKALKMGGHLRGVRLHWSGVEVAHEDMAMRPNGFHVYRCLEGGAWTLIGRTVGAQSTFTDTSYDGSARATYALVHMVRLNFDYSYEGLYGKPLSVGPFH